MTFADFLRTNGVKYENRGSSICVESFSIVSFRRRVWGWLVVIVLIPTMFWLIRSLTDLDQGLIVGVSVAIVGFWMIGWLIGLRQTVIFHPNELEFRHFFVSKIQLEPARIEVCMGFPFDSAGVVVYGREKGNLHLFQDSRFNDRVQLAMRLRKFYPDAELSIDGQLISPDESLEPKVVENQK